MSSLPYLCIPIDKNALGLGNVDNTSDANKPVSTAQAAADAAVLASANSYTNASIAALPAAPVTSVAGKTGVVTLVKADVGLGNVDNTSDVNKPVSTAQAAADALKANLAGGNTWTGTQVFGTGNVADFRNGSVLFANGQVSLSSVSGAAPVASPTFTGTVVLPSTTSVGSVSATEIGYIDGLTSNVQTQLNGKASLAGSNNFLNAQDFQQDVSFATTIGVGDGVLSRRFASFADVDLALYDSDTDVWVLGVVDGSSLTGTAANFNVEYASRAGTAVRLDDPGSGASFAYDNVVELGWVTPNNIISGGTVFAASGIRSNALWDEGLSVRFANYNGTNWTIESGTDGSNLSGNAGGLFVGAASKVIGVTGQSAFQIDGVEYYPHVTAGVLTFTDTP